MITDALLAVQIAIESHRQEFMHRKYHDGRLCVGCQMRNTVGSIRFRDVESLQSHLRHCEFFRGFIETAAVTDSAFLEPAIRSFTLVTE